MTAEESNRSHANDLRHPVPGWYGEYEVDDDIFVWTVGRTITRASGWKYTIRPRRRRWTRDRHSGLYYMKLCRSGRYTDIWRHLVMAQVFGDTDTQEAS